MSAQIKPTPVSPNYGRTVSFRMDGAPVGKGRPRARVVTPKGKKPFVSLYTPEETRDYEERVGKAAARQMVGAAPSTRPCEMQITIYLEIPPAWPKWKREAATRQEIVPTGKPDISNVVKAIEDGMVGIVYADDAQVMSQDVCRLYAPEGQAGYIDIIVRENWRCASGISRIADLVLLR